MTFVLKDPSSDGNEPLLARALLELTRRIGCSKVARLEKCSKNFGSKLDSGR